MSHVWGPGKHSGPLTPSLGLEKDRSSQVPVYQMGLWHRDPVGLDKSEQNSLTRFIKISRPVRLIKDWQERKCAIHTPWGSRRSGRVLGKVLVLAT